MLFVHEYTVQHTTLCLKNVVANVVAITNDQLALTCS